KTIEPLRNSQKEACVLDTNQNGYWNFEKLLKQVRWAINIFEQTHLGYVGIFVFDNATSYKALSENALVASKMNFCLGDLASKM
ncbi:9489_t:CDS:2, partial [Cetraspora pellucida]